MGEEGLRDIPVEGYPLGRLINEMIFIANYEPFVLGDRKGLDEHQQLICRNYDRLIEEINEREKRSVDTMFV